MIDALFSVNSVTAIITSEKSRHIAPRQIPEKNATSSGRLLSGLEICIVGDKLGLWRLRATVGFNVS